MNYRLCRTFFIWAFLFFQFFLSLANVEVTRLGEWGTGYYEDVYVNGDMAYCAALAGGLDILDISNPSNPQLIQNFETMGRAEGVFVTGNYAYVALGSDGLQIININNPYQPVMTGWYDAQWQIVDVVVDGNYAYIADDNDGLQIINISDPSNPFYVGSYDSDGHTVDVVVSGDYIYIADYDEGLLILDISDPSTPEYVGGYNTSGYALAVFISGNYAFIADEGSGLQIFDITNPASPQLTGNYKGAAEDVYDVTVIGNTAYVADYYDGLLTVDISNPSSPSLLDTFDTEGRAYSVNISGNHAYIADYYDGLIIINISNPSNLVLSGQYSFSGYGNDVVISGNYAYFLNGGLQIIDITNPSSPSLTGSYNDTSGFPKALFLSGDAAYIADFNFGLLILNISDPSNPVFAGDYHTQGAVYDVCVVDNIVYLLDSYYGLFVLDITDPSTPVLLDTYDSPGLAYGIHVSGNYAYIADYFSGLQVIDISTPSSINHVGNYDTSGNAYDIFVSGNTAYIADDRSGLQIIDISEPSNPQLAGTYDTPGSARGVTVWGNYAYVSDFLNGMKIVDIKDPSNPQLAGSYDTPGFCSNSYVTENIMVAADGDSGKLLVFDNYEFFIYNIPHVATTSNWETWVIADNADILDHLFTITLYDNSGSAVSSEEYNISAGHTRNIQLTQGNTGKVEYSGSNMFFRASYVQTVEEGIAEFSLDGLTSSNIDFNMPQYLIDKLDWMGVALMNPNNTSANCHLESLDLNGNIIDTADIIVDSDTQRVGQVYDFFTDIDYSNLARISVNSDQPVCGITISGQGTSKLLFTKASNRDTQPDTLNIPHIASQFNTWDNLLVFDNTGTTAVTVSLHLYSNGIEVVSEAIEIASNSNHLINLNDYSGLAVDCGVITDVPESLNVRISYLYKSTDSTAEFLLNNNSSQNIVYNFPGYAFEKLTWMGMAIFNPGEPLAKLNLIATKEGVEVDSVSMDLSGLTKFADTLENIFPDSFENGIDRVIVYSDQPVTGLNISGSGLDRLLFTLAQNFEAVP